MLCSSTLKDQFPVAESSRRVDVNKLQINSNRGKLFNGLLMFLFPFFSVFGVDS